MVGFDVFDGAWPAATVSLSADTAEFVPDAFVAVTVTRIVEPTSDAPTS